jgi:hypothetical protein
MTTCRGGRAKGAAVRRIGRGRGRVEAATGREAAADVVEKWERAKVSVYL